MTREFIYALRFDKSFGDLGLKKDDLIKIEKLLLDNPDTGDIIEGTGGLRKMRYALPNQGKSGSTRILYVDFAYYEKIYMLDIYIKKDKDNLSNSEKANVKQTLKALESKLRSDYHE